MSLVSSRLALIHACTIERDSNVDGTTDDGWGTAPAWEPLAEGVLCRFWTRGGRETVTNGDSVVAVDEQMLIVPLGTDVTTTDRISAIAYRGDTLVAGPLGIRAINPRLDHLELVLMGVGQ